MDQTKTAPQGGQTELLPCPFCGGAPTTVSRDLDGRVQALQREVEALRADKARLVEDRARFPDRPDDIGRMIAAHCENLKATAKAHEDAWRRAQLNADANAPAAARYRWMRDRFLGADFNWNESGKQVLLIEFSGGPVSGCLDSTLESAMASKAEVPNG